MGIGISRSEGVAVDRDGNLYGASGNRSVYKLSPNEELSIFARLPERTQPAGLTFDRDGNLICCDVGTGAVLRIDRSGKIAAIADSSGNPNLASPNFPTFDAYGNLYVSNSTYNHDTAIQRGEFLEPAANGALVRIRRNGLVETMATGLFWANGTAIDPGEDHLYVLQSTKRNCLRFRLKKDGTPGSAEIYAQDFPGMPDGMAFAEDGTMFVTVPVTMGPQYSILNTVLKVEQDGTWSEFLSDPAGTVLSLPTNCAFAGRDRRDLIIANAQGDHFSRIRTEYVGHRLYHQR